MARFQFGGGIADWTFAAIDNVDGEDEIVGLAGGVVVTFWNAETGGAQLTDLLDSDGTTPIVSVVSSLGGDGRGVGQIPTFFGPDGLDRLWAQGDDGPRVLMSAVGIGSVDDLDGRFVTTELYIEQGTVLVGASAGVPTPVSVGSDGQVLTADSAQPSGVRWTSPAGTNGNVLYWSGSDYVPTGLKAAVDPEVPRIFIGPVDPASVTGVVLSPIDWHDTWIGT
ncbi:hypothetical protein BDK92_7241 [Micromonospora pisi]|uniref:Uncharacterized protein n=1 Tax=Micromonospora pisi TaxID=589240 RepID=A0A495JVA4_9ACTN|nr:hypothetical protein [Micromonospora pisi]RKR92761.1 hypothetical protein BDK92_7241 [Micromonospora pisi]